MAKREKIELTEKLEPKYITYEELSEKLKRHGLGKKRISVIINYIESGAGSTYPVFEDTDKGKKIM